MPRVHEVARDLGITSREAIARLEGLGVTGKTHASALDPATEEMLRASVGDGAATAAVPATGAAATTVELTERVPDDASRTATQEELPEAAARALHRRKRRRSLAARIIEIPFLVLVAFVIAIVIKTFLVQAFFIPSSSMFPTLHVGDRVLVEKISYALHEPRRHDVVVFAKSVFGDPEDVPWHVDAQNFVRELLGLPTGGEEDYIKRIVAIAGDVVEYSGSPRRLRVNGTVVPQPFISKGRDSSSPTLTEADCERLEMTATEGGCRVPAGKVFVMGDNRGNSEDSRVLGPVDEDKIIGRAFVIVWPPSNLGGL